MSSLFPPSSPPPFAPELESAELTPLRTSYIVDSADKDSFPAAKAELHALLEKPELQGIPVLVRPFASPSNLRLSLTRHGGATGPRQ